MSKISIRELNRRKKIERGVISEMAKISGVEQSVFAPEALKELSKIRVSLGVLKEIITNSDAFENVNKITGTTRLVALLLDIKYKFTVQGSLKIKKAQIGGVDLKVTNEDKTIKNVPMQNNFKVHIYIDSNRNFGEWELTVSEIKQKLSSGTVVKRSLNGSPIKRVVRQDSDRRYDKKVLTTKI